VVGDDLEPAHLGGRIWFIGFLRVVGQEPFLDALYDDASKIGCSGYVFEVFRKLIDELVASICSRVAEVQVVRCFELNAFFGQVSVAAPFR
jgi:hypothetical protein